MAGGPTALLPLRRPCGTRGRPVSDGGPRKGGGQGSGGSAPALRPGRLLPPRRGKRGWPRRDRLHAPRGARRSRPPPTCPRPALRSRPRGPHFPFKPRSADRTRKRLLTRGAADWSRRRPPSMRGYGAAASEGRRADAAPPGTGRERQPAGGRSAAFRIAAGPGRAPEAGSGTSDGRVLCGIGGAAGTREAAAAAGLCPPAASSPCAG